MKRRVFLMSGTASALALAGCGGGGDAEELAEDTQSAAAGRRIKNRTTTTTTPTTTTPTPETTTSPTTTTGVAFPFGARLMPYVAGTRPNQANATMDALLTRHYDAWRAARVVPATSVAGGACAVKISQAAFLTVSEATGYGMLLAVLFASHDPNARQLFDGLLALARARPAYAVVPHDPNGKYLMEWRLNTDGSSGGEGWNAMDGDLDLAMALLMAHRQWGSTGAWNYLQEAKNTIAALKSWNMAADGTTKGLYRADISRTSDYMIGHFRAFQAATGDSFWSTAIDRAYSLSDRMQTVYSPGLGLMPDFIVGTNTSSPVPASPYNGGDRSEHDGKFYWNACRNPWRFATDYVLSGDARWKTVTSRMVDFFNSKVQAAGGDIMAIECGYALNGTALAGGDSAAFIAPVMLGACVDAKYQSLVDAGWNWNAARPVTGYYDGEIQLLSMVVASGNWWTYR